MHRACTHKHTIVARLKKTARMVRDGFENGKSVLCVVYVVILH